AGARAARRKRAHARSRADARIELPGEPARGAHVVTMPTKYVPLPEAAARLGCSPEFIERLEHEGLIDLKRTLDDVVVISADGVERVRFIALLTEELEVNLPGAEVILHMRDDMIA